MNNTKNRLCTLAALLLGVLVLAAPKAASHCKCWRRVMVMLDWVFGVDWRMVVLLSLWSVLRRSRSNGGGGTVRGWNYRAQGPASLAAAPGFAVFPRAFLKSRGGRDF